MNTPEPTTSPGSLTPPRRRAVKACLLGDASTGKTSIRQRIFTGSFTAGYRTTVGADFLSKTIHLDGLEPASLALWDTAGQERFRSLASAFYRGSDACLLVYNTTDPNTLNSLRSWFDEFKRRCPVDEDALREYPFVVVGNKVDLLGPGNEGVSEEEVNALLRELVPPLEEDESGQAEGYQVGDATPPLPTSIEPPSHPSHPSHPQHQHQHHRQQTRIDVLPPLPKSDSIRRLKHLSAETYEPSDIGTMRTTNTIYHTPQSSFHDNISNEASHVNATGERDEQDETEYSDDEDDCSSYVGDEEHSRFEREQEQARGVDIYMATSPPHRPAFLPGSKVVYQNPNERLFKRRKSGPGGVVDTRKSTSGDSFGHPIPSKASFVPNGPVADEYDYSKDGIKHFRTSAKTGEGINEALEYLIRKVTWRARRQEQEDVVRAEQANSTIRVGDEVKRSKWREACCP